MLSWLKFRKLDEGTRSRIEACRELVANTNVVSIRPFGDNLDIEVLIIPAITPEGKKKTPRFVFPGGGTDLFLCIEPALHSDSNRRETIIISPLGYGKSSDIPKEVLQNPLLHAVVNLHLLRTTGKKKIILSGHSNANSIQGETAVMAPEFGIEVERIEMTNPLGLRRLWKIWAGLCFTISGGLTRLASWFVEHPVDLLKGVYQVPKRPLKMGYEMDKACAARLPEIFRRMNEQGARVPVLLVLSSWNWGSLHLWGPSDEKIFRKYFSAELLRIVRIRGLHNATLGPNSKVLAEVTERLWHVNMSLIFFLMPQLPAFASWLSAGLGLA